MAQRKQVDNTVDTVNARSMDRSTPGPPVGGFDSPPANTNTRRLASQGEMIHRVLTEPGRDHFFHVMKTLDYGRQAAHSHVFQEIQRSSVSRVNATFHRTQCKNHPRHTLDGRDR
jgi:hypothetical protein